jgi:hypothetical protein
MRVPHPLKKSARLSRKIEERFLHFAASARFASKEKDWPLRWNDMGCVGGWSGSLEKAADTKQTLPAGWACEELFILP